LDGSAATAAAASAWAATANFAAEGTTALREVAGEDEGAGAPGTTRGVLNVRWGGEGGDASGAPAPATSKRDDSVPQLEMGVWEGNHNILWGDGKQCAKSRRWAT